MNYLKLFAAAAVPPLMAGCSGTESQASYDVIPAPCEVTVDAAAAPFVLSSSTPVVYTEGDSVLARYAGFLAEYVKDQTGISLSVKPGDPMAAKASIVLTADNGGENPEGYVLNVSEEGVSIAGNTAAGTFYGVQTLRKSIPVEKVDKVLLPAVTINDEPRFAYRGGHLDVSRHFFPADSVKTYIDMLAMHNINRFHWHLTDDQGWRIEIKSRPRLTEVGSHRDGTIIGRTHDYDSIPVDGFYTREELKDIVKYAADRNIEIIPEVDLPGHMLAALESYPELGCTGGPYKVWGRWGVAEDVLCAGNPETLKFLDDVFSELVDIFPSKVYHIGGDECPKVRWKECKVCQAAADRLGFRNDSHGTREAKLQNYVMHHVADFLAQHGRRVIGWDEVLDSDFSENAMVMSWRGEQGGIEGARRGHDVIMTPCPYLYFDYYQTGDTENEPLAIGGYIPVEKVYGYEPVPEVLTEEEARHIKGVQANVWTEFIPTFSQVQYMALPRFGALSEVQWTRKGTRNDFDEFAARLTRMTDLYRNQGWNFATHIFDIHDSRVIDTKAGTVTVSLGTYDNAPIHYTLDGTEPTENSPVFTEPIVMSEAVQLNALAFRDGKPGRLYSNTVAFSKATGKPVTLNEQPVERFTFGGAPMLTDGTYGSPTYADGHWLGFQVPVVEATIDMETPQTISKASIRNKVATADWIFDARSFEVLVSADGKEYTSVAKTDIPEMVVHTTKINEHALEFEPVEARYVKFRIGSEASMPQWHYAPGRQALLFLDELNVY